MDLHDFNKLLADAIQGTASKYADPDKIVQAAAATAKSAAFIGGELTLQISPWTLNGTNHY